MDLMINSDQAEPLRPRPGGSNQLKLADEGDEISFSEFTQFRVVGVHLVKRITMSIIVHRSILQFVYRYVSCSYIQNMEINSIALGVDEKLKKSTKKP